MIINPYLHLDGALTLQAFSYSHGELRTIEYVLNRADVNFRATRIQRDENNRDGMRFDIPARHLSRLENYLDLKFIGGQGQTYVEFGEAWSHADGQGSSNNSYRCTRVDNPPIECETIYAKDDREATFKCALVARQRKWLGGVPNRGAC